MGKEGKIYIIPSMRKEAENHSLLSDMTKNGLTQETLSTSQEKGIGYCLSEKFNPYEHPPEQ
jgi:hypothetical protein